MSSNKNWIFNGGKMLRSEYNYLNPGIDIDGGDLRYRLEMLFGCELKIYLIFNLTQNNTRLLDYRYNIIMNHALVATVNTTLQQNIFITKLKLVSTKLLRDKYKIPKHITVKKYFIKKTFNRFLGFFETGPGEDSEINTLYVDDYCHVAIREILQRKIDIFLFKTNLIKYNILVRELRSDIANLVLQFSSCKTIGKYIFPIEESVSVSMCL